MHTGTAKQTRAKLNLFRNRPCGKLHKGLTLLEVVLATAIFSIVMVATSGAWFVHQRAINNSSARTTAAFLGLQELNRCVAAGYANLLVATHPTQNIEIVNQQHGRSSKAIYQSTTTVQQDPVTNFKRIYVQVAWQETRGVQSLNYEVYLHPSNQGLSIASPTMATQALVGPSY